MVFMSKKAFILGVITLIVSLSSTAWGADIRQTLFKDADKVLMEARQKNADLYSPSAFEEGVEYYANAEKQLQKGSSTSRIQKNINKAVAFFKRALKNAEVAQIVFAKVMAARQDALKAKAEGYDPETFQEAEKMFRAGAKTLESGSSNDAKKKALEAEETYRKAELMGIKSQMLKGVWQLLNKLDEMKADKYAPITFHKAVQLTRSCEELITRNRYSLDESNQVAQQAYYTARHAIYLTQLVKKWHKERKSYELVWLESEIPLIQIGEAVGAVVEFDQGRDIPTKNILDTVRNLVNENEVLSVQLKEKEAENDKLLSENEEMQRRLGKTDSINKKLKAQAKRQRERKMKLARISRSFSPREGTLLMKGENVILRLHGLNFSPGKADIEPQYFALLTKVKKVFEQFPGCMVIIEGHTDSKGGDLINKRLSYARAEAVQQFIIADGVMPKKRVRAIGYGETRPVASNDTNAGRKKNRRIDVVIRPVEQD